MKQLFILLFLLLVPALASAIVLNGTLQDDSGHPFANTKIGIMAGPSQDTDSKGQFSLSLTRDFVSGERVIIRVSKPGWVIFRPIEGEWNLPNDRYQQVQTSTVILVPKGSKKLWENQRIEQFIARLSDKLSQARNELVKAGQTPRPVDFSSYLNEWGEQYGFTPEEVRTQFDLWARQAAVSKELNTRALAEFYRKNFADAAHLFEEAAKQGEARQKALEEAERQNKLEVYSNWKGAGNSYVAMYRFDEALVAYQKAQAVVANRNDFPMAWAEIRVLMGNTYSQIAGQADAAHFAVATMCYNEALQVFTQEALPLQWATTQNNLGNALIAQGVRLEGIAGQNCLREAVAAFRKALEVRTQDALPRDWAMTQSHLGHALTALGEITEGQESIILLREAQDACLKALEVQTQYLMPWDWAMTQSNLGHALTVLGERAERQEALILFREATEAYQKSLKIQTQDVMSPDWAITQENLGNVLKSLGEITNGIESYPLFQQAVDAHLKALVFFKREIWPADWAAAQNNLGVVLNSQGKKTDGVEGLYLFEDAVAAYRKSLEIRTREAYPYEWVKTQYNLANALGNQGERTEGLEGIHLLKEAVDAYQVLVLYARECDLTQMETEMQFILSITKSMLDLRLIMETGEDP